MAGISTQQGLPERVCGDRSFVRLGIHTEKHVPDHQCSLPSLSCMSRDLANRGWTLRLPCLKHSGSNMNKESQESTFLHGAVVLKTHI
jgi:hypothetical protein